MRNEITPYNRLKKALEHKEPDRIPFDIGADCNTGIHIKTYRKIKEYLGLDSSSARILDPITQRAVVERDFKQKLNIDVDGIYPEPSDKWEFIKKDKGEYWAFEDEFGIKWRMPKENGLYYDMYQHPLSGDISEEDIKNYEFYDATDSSRFIDFEDEINRANNKQKPYIINALGAGIFELALWIRGFSDFYMDLAGDPQKAELLLDKLLAFKKRYWEKALEFTGERMVIAGEADDLAGQKNTLISPEMYRKFIKPRHKELFDFIKNKAKGDVYIFYHSCGAVRELIPDLIEEGVDILNPVQISAKNMDLYELKKEFGKNITFWGGGIDTQETLPYGTPEEVREETKRNIELLAPGGGFVFATVHNVQADVPVENFMAMWETLQESGVY